MYSTSYTEENNNINVMDRWAESCQAHVVQHCNVLL